MTQSTSFVVHRGIAVAALLAGIFMLLGYAPPIIGPDGAYLGESFRIFFFHVPAAWVSFLLFFAGGVYAGLYLWKRGEEFDRSSAAAVEVGWVFATIVIVTGPIWAKAAWGVYWTWEPRLTSFLILWLSYLGYLVLRQAIEEPEKRALFSSALAIVSFLNIPLVIFSIRIWGAKGHPSPGGGYFADPALRVTIFANIAAFLLTAAYLFRKRRAKEAVHV